MKKAKMALAAIAVFAIVGGVYATKAAKRGQIALCTTTSTGTPVAIPDYKVSNVGLPYFCLTTTTATRVTATRITNAD